MSTGMKRRWWRAAAVALAGAAAGGGWFGLARAEPIRVPVTAPTPAVRPADAPTVWMRSPSPLGSVPVPDVKRSAPDPVATPAPATVTPASAVVTAPAAPAVPVEAAPKFRPMTVIQVPVAAPADDKFKPAVPALPALPSDGGKLPTVPAVPSKPVASPAAPAPEWKPAVPPKPAAAPLPTTPAPAAALPLVPSPVPPPPSPAASVPLAPPPAAVPALPSPPPVAARPIPPTLPPPPATAGPKAPPAPTVVRPPAVAPPARPTNSTAPARPVSPAAPDLRLRPGNDGNSVKVGEAPVVVTRKPTAAPPAAEPAKPAPQAMPVVAAPPARPPEPAPIAPVAPPIRPAAPPLAATVSRPVPPKPDARETTPGDRAVNLKQTTVAALVGGALAFTPAAPAAAFPLPKPTAPVAADPQSKTADKSTEERLKDIEKQLARLTELLEGRKDAQGFTIPTDEGLVADVKKLRNDISSLKEDVKKSTSLRPSTTTTTPDPVANKGTVRVVNDYPVEIAIVVNSQSYRVAPNTKLDIPIAPGDFTYQLLNTGASLTPVRSVIKEKEVVTLRIK